MSSIPFTKMHGIGNDFVVIDHRKQEYEFNIQKIADRKFGVGCDQVIVINKSIDADCYLDIYNLDGSKASACGNATRCVAFLLMKEKNLQEVSIAIGDRILKCWEVECDKIRVDMGEPLLNWQDIPLSYACDTLNLPLSDGILISPVAVNMGNPHVIFFVDDVSSLNLSHFGPKIEKYSLFPEGVNVNVAQIVDDKRIMLRVWERGVGETDACGSGACATCVAAVRKKLISSNKAVISFIRGELFIEWQNHVFMTGVVETVYTGLYQT